METTAEKLLCDSTSCVQQTAAATQNSTVILLYLVLIEFALEKLFIKKKKKRNTAISTLREIFPDSTFCEQAYVLGILGMKNFVKLVPRCISEGWNKKTSQGRIFPSLVSKQRRLFRAAKLMETSSLSNFWNMQGVVFVSTNGSKRESRMCCSPVFYGLHVQKPSHSEPRRLKCWRENKINLHFFKSAAS